MSTRKDWGLKSRLPLNTALYIVLPLLALGSLATPRAQAATQEFRGCVNVEDTLDSPETPTLSGVGGMPIQVEYEALGIFLPGIGSLTTNDSGCFSATLSGFTVPKETRIRLNAKLKDSRQGVANDAGDTYKIELDTRSVLEGTREDFGDIDFTLANSSDETHGAILMWHAVNRAVEAYRSRVGSWDFSQRLWIYFPADQEVATGGDGGLRIPLGRRDKFSGPFLHELGHFISDSDVSTYGTRKDYCAVKEAEAYPEDRSPYTYRKDSEQEPGADCGHSFGSYEYVQRAFAEGFADAVSDYLSDGICQNGNGVAELGFDKKNSELNVMKLVCRAMDSGEHTSTGLHSYGESDSHLEIFEGSSYSATPYIHGNRIFLADGRKIFSVDIQAARSSERLEPEAVYRFSSTVVSTVYELFRVGPKLCALVRSATGMKEIHCRNEDFVSTASIGAGRIRPGDIRVDPLPEPVSSSMPSISFGTPSALSDPSVASLRAFIRMDPDSLPVDPGSGGYLLDVYAHSDRLFLLYQVNTSGGQRLGAYQAAFDPLSTTTGFTRSSWTQIFEIDVGGHAFSQIAVDSSKSRLFVSDMKSIYSCHLSRGCSMLRRWAGSLSEVGYRRSTRKNSIFGTIGNLQISGEDLYISDQRGVSRAGFGTAATDEVVQVVGTGEDPVFANNLSLRSLQYFFPASTPGGFYIDDNWIVTSGSYSPFNETRGVDSQQKALFLADRSIPVVSQVYCGSENVSASARKVVRTYQFAPHYYMNASDFYTALQSSTGMSTSNLTSLKEHSWLSLNSTGCTLQGGQALDFEIDAGQPQYPGRSFSPGDRTPGPLDHAALLSAGENRAEVLRGKVSSDIRRRMLLQESRSSPQCGGGNFKREPPRDDAVMKAPLKRQPRPGVVEKSFRRPERRFPPSPSRLEGESKGTVPPIWRK